MPRSKKSSKKKKKDKKRRRDEEYGTRGRKRPKKEKRPTRSRSSSDTLTVNSLGQIVGLPALAPSTGLTEQQQLLRKELLPQETILHDGGSDPPSNPAIVPGAAAPRVHLNAMSYSRNADPVHAKLMRILERELKEIRRG